MVKVKVNVNFALEQAMKAQRGVGGIALHILYLGTRWGGDKRHAPAFLVPGKSRYP